MMAAMYRDTEARNAKGLPEIRVARDPQWSKVAHLIDVAQRRAS